MAAAAKEVTFLVPGQAQAGPSTRGGVKAAVRVGAQRGGGEAVRVTARVDEDVVSLTIANGPTLVLHPEHARALLQAQAGEGTRGPAATRGTGEVAVSSRLGWPGHGAAATRGATRGWMGEATLTAFEVLTGLSKDPAVDLATAAITRKLDGAVEEGVYQLAPEAPLKALKGSGALQANVAAAADGGPLLVLIHGTFVDTVSTFGKLWTGHPRKVRELFTAYGGRVYALDHPTLGKSPIANALALVRAMPAGARLHLLTHSRGGLVAEVLARACGGGPLTDAELAPFAAPQYAAHRADLRALATMAQAKGLRVERMVRVACPSRGTLLASKRLDAYLSVLQWGLQLAEVPVAPQLVDFLHEVARRRANPAELPGLEALMPESPLVAWLNGRAEPIAGDLRVVAGDLEGDSVGSWVKTLMADAFYWTDNDLVVQTRSMYGGMPRGAGAPGAGASFLLDRGAKVTHFNYFANERTVAAIVAALTQAQPEGFAAIGPLSWAGQDASGTRAAPLRALRGDPAEQPAVLVLPGIVGSNLKLDGQRIWLGLGFINGLKKLAWSPATAARIQPDGPVSGTYEALMEHLSDTHEVIPFAYDWRRPIEDEARRLAVAVDAALDARAATGQPVRLLAHSMGGLVARTMQLETPATWQRMMAQAGARLLMLGTPNSGSWAPMQTLSGDDNFGNALVAFGSLFDNAGARTVMAGMPGFIQLQASLLDPALGLNQAAAWQKLADDDMAALLALVNWHDPETQRTIYQWGAPPQAVLDQAVALRQRLDAQLPVLAADAAKMLLVVGHSAFTPAGFVTGPDGLEYLDTPDGGDGRVTLANALLPNVATWKVDAVHGMLPAAVAAFEAYTELLATGQTGKLEAHARGVRGLPMAPLIAAGPGGLVRSRPSHGLQVSQPPASGAEVIAGVADASDGQRVQRNTSALNVTVRNGDLQFIRAPLLIGHYRAMRLTGAEAVVDRLTGRALSQALRVGLYPDAPGSHQVFGGERCVVVVGMGEEGKLRTLDLVFSVRQAVLAYAQHLAERPGGAPAHFEMAATLMGSGGTGITTASAAQAIAQGALEANQKLQDNGWPQLGHLTLVEVYLDRATEAWRALQQQQQAAPNRLRLERTVESGPGSMRRTLESGYRGASYDFISASTTSGPAGKACITYKLDTRRARSEVTAQHAQGNLLRELVAKASNDASADRLIGRTLFDLLVPVEIEPFLGGTSEVVIEVDPGTAAIPWELLDTNPDGRSADARPWAMRSRLIRKLQTGEFRAKVVDAGADDGVLVIGEPKCDPPYARLDGARREAVAVAQRLGAGGIAADKLRALVDQQDAQTIINALFERPYRVVHIAGHGAPGPAGGVVLSGDSTYLGATEVRAMRTIPELVFLNCCHLAARDANTTAAPYDRAAFAANISDELIRAGVRCVIAAGWAVEDDAAEQFAVAFYGSLLGGNRFMDAVAKAREAAWAANRRGNTWAAYQCYGDPDWAWRREGADAQQPAAPLGDEFASIASPVSLVLALENLAVESEFRGAKPRAQVDKLRYLEAQFESLWGDIGVVAEAFGTAYAAAGAVEPAIDWYGRALAAPDGTAGIRTAQRLAALNPRAAAASSTAAAATRPRRPAAKRRP